MWRHKPHLCASKSDFSTSENPMQTRLMRSGAFFGVSLEESVVLLFTPIDILVLFSLFS